MNSIEFVERILGERREMLMEVERKKNSDFAWGDMVEIPHPEHCGCVECDLEAYTRKRGIFRGMRKKR